MKCNLSRLLFSSYQLLAGLRVSKWAGGEPDCVCVGNGRKKSPTPAIIKEAIWQLISQ